jgi:phage tail-like protein
VRKWCQDAIENLEIKPVTVWVTLLNDAHEPLQTYTVVNAWPKKWSVSDFNAESGEVVVESLDLAYQRFKLD